MTVSNPPAAALTARALSSDADHVLWNEFVGQSPEGDVLQAWEWGLVKSPDWIPLRFGVFRDGALVAGVALLRRALPVIGPYY